MVLYGASLQSSNRVNSSRRLPETVYDLLPPTLQPLTSLNASVVELVDTLVSEASGRKPVEVQVLSLAPYRRSCSDEQGSRLPRLTCCFESKLVSRSRVCASGIKSCVQSATVSASRSLATLEIVTGAKAPVTQ